ncbi:MAG: hypothetical protein J6M90_02060 [Oscillospiraceae bacterium]|nr:hypothetical protein [Oscillospiraceae bacterium]
MIRFHLPEAHNSVSFFIGLVDIYARRRELFRDNVEIASFFGSRQLIWNGGRAILIPYDAKSFKNFIKLYNEYGIPYRFTFTNTMITEEYLDDYDCNDILDFADNGLNEVIVYSPILEEYIRKTHPNMKITSSTCKCIRDIDEVKAELAKPYSLVVLDFNFNNDFEKLEKLTPEERKRCEILSNPVCRPGCTRRLEHYNYISKAQLTYPEWLDSQRMLPPDKRVSPKEHFTEWECKDRIFDPFGKKEYPLRVTPELVYGKYAEMGFENFKIEGRMANIMMLAEQISRYMAKPECVDEFRYEVMVRACDPDRYKLNLI